MFNVLFCITLHIQKSTNHKRQNSTYSFSVAYDYAYLTYFLSSYMEQFLTKKLRRIQKLINCKYLTLTHK